MITKEHLARLIRNSDDRFLNLIKDIKYNVQPQTLTNSKFSQFAQECTKIFKEYVFIFFSQKDNFKYENF